MMPGTAEHVSSNSMSIRFSRPRLFAQSCGLLTSPVNAPRSVSCLHLVSDRSPTNRSACSNIADNPVHETLPDKLIGTKTVVETRLAKYVAVSLLTRDLLDTSAVRKNRTIIAFSLSSAAATSAVLQHLGHGVVSTDPCVGLSSFGLSVVRAPTKPSQKNWRGLVILLKSSSLSFAAVCGRNRKDG